MEGEEEMSELFNKLVAIRKSVEYIQKTEKGNQNAMYVDPAVLIRKIRNGMDEMNLLLVPSMKNSSVESIPDPTKANPDAKSFIFKSDFEYTFIDAESGDKLSIPWFITGKHLQDPAMAGGSALTYFERYFMLKFFQIPTSKDDPEYFEEKTKDTDSVRLAINSAVSIIKTVEELGKFYQDNKSKHPNKKEFNLLVAEKKALLEKVE